MFFFNKKKSPMIDNIYFNGLPSSVRLQLEALKSLDPYTKKHIEDVPKHVYKICMQLGIGGDNLDFLMTAAYLHDVGKIFVPSAILQKNGKLTSEEYAIMKTHATKGYEICMSLEDLRPYAKVVRGHHESLDGLGYPDGLKEKEISYETMIVKVADVYSALSNKRQYKEAFSTREIFEIMYKDVASNKMPGNMVYALLSAIIEEKQEQLLEIKTHLNESRQQLQYNECILEYLDEYANKQMDNSEVLNNIKQNKYIKKLKGLNINNISDANKLLVTINNNIINLSKSIANFEAIKKDLNDLKEYANLIIMEM